MTEHTFDIYYNHGVLDDPFELTYIAHTFNVYMYSIINENDKHPVVFIGIVHRFEECVEKTI